MLVKNLLPQPLQKPFLPDVKSPATDSLKHLNRISTRYSLKAITPFRLILLTSGLIFMDPQSPFNSVAPFIL
jgi:hypothetical protein